MIQGRWFAPGEDLSAGVLPVRRAVFGREGDALDAQSWNVLVLEDGTPAAAGRIWWAEGAFWLGEIGVTEERRGRRLGDLTLRLLLFKAQSHSAREVRLRCPAETAGFFARLGLREDAAAAPSDGWVEMTLPGDAIELDSCKNCPRDACPSRKA